MTNVGIMGLAHMHSDGYIEALSKIPDVEIKAVYDDNLRHGREVAEKIGSKFFSNPSDFLRSEIEGVVVCSENSHHVGMVLQAAKAKKHILCEKPLATTKKDALKMVDICEKEGVILQIAFPCRYSPMVKTGLPIIRDGVIGKIISVNCTNHGTMPGGWFVDPKLSGGGCIMDHTVHVVDLLRWILGKEIVKVYAEANSLYYNLEVEDAGLLSLTFEDGVYATLDTSWSRPKESYPSWGDVVLDFTGTLGMLHIDLSSQNILLFNNDEVRAKLVGWGDNLDFLLLEDWIKAIREKRQPICSGLDGLKALEVTVGAYESIRLKRPVDLMEVKSGEKKIMGQKATVCGAKRPTSRVGG